METEATKLAPYEQKPEGMTEQCPTCLRWFPNKKSLNMHKDRAHTKKIKTPGEGKRMSAEERRLAKRRWYQKRKKKGTSGVPWTPERRAKFNSTWRSKARLRAKFHAKIQAGLQAKRQERNSEHLPDPRQFINFCPGCGLDLRSHYLAAGFKHHEPKA